jgi:hypothetical protein
LAGRGYSPKPKIDEMTALKGIPKRIALWLQSQSPEFTGVCAMLVDSFSYAE